MNFSVCLLSVIPVRKEPSHRSEMTSQVLFGEFVETFDEADDFIRVKCLYDGYGGWVQKVQLSPVEGNQVSETTQYVGMNTGEVLVNGNCLNIPFAVPVHYPEPAGKRLNWGTADIQYSVIKEAVWDSYQREFTRENFMPIEKIFLNTPYLWGGKSVFGIDCSGFCQQVFKLFGIKLLRDAYLQATQGAEVSLDESKFGDLAFFNNEKGRITHVGILLGNGMIVHASGKVRIDPVNADGIKSTDSGKRTHVLHSVRRVE